MSLIRKFLAASLIIAASISSSSAYSFKTVVIDPGHGGHDKGGVWGQVYEKHLALDTSARLEIELRKRGFHTVMTRRGDYFVTLPDRCRISSRYSNAIFVAIHYNYTWNQGASGLETYYTTPQSKPLSDYVQACLNRRMNCLNRGSKFARFYVIRNNTNPAILVECGFVSNGTERNRMKGGVYRQALAVSIAEGIQRFRTGF
jgi:N-acetylmuramoyl-L-alanine amidase